MNFHLKVTKVFIPCLQTTALDLECPDLPVLPYLQHARRGSSCACRRYCGVRYRGCSTERRGSHLGDAQRQVRGHRGGQGAHRHVQRQAARRRLRRHQRARSGGRGPRLGDRAECGVLLLQRRRKGSAGGVQRRIHPQGEVHLTSESSTRRLQQQQQQQQTLGTRIAPNNQALALPDT